MLFRPRPLARRSGGALDFLPQVHGEACLLLEMSLQKARRALFVAIECRFHDGFVIAVCGDSALGVLPEIAPVALHVIVQFVEEMQ